MSSSLRDVATAAVVGVVGGLPVVGSVLSSTIAATLAAKQRAVDEEFWAFLAARVERLEQSSGARRFDPSDAEFYAAARRANRMAHETGNREKRRLLAEALADAGSWSVISLDRRERYLGLVTQLSPDHVRALHFLRDPGLWLQQHHPGSLTSVKGAPMTSVRAVFDEYVLGGSTALAREINSLLEDLQAERLAGMGLQTIRRGTDALGSHTTADGNGFLTFLGELPEKLWVPESLDCPQR